MKQIEELWIIRNKIEERLEKEEFLRESEYNFLREILDNIDNLIATLED